MLLIGAIAGVAVFAFLYTLASRLWWELTLHDLQVEARKLHIEHERRLAALRAGETVELAPADAG